MRTDTLYKFPPSAVTVRKLVLGERWESLSVWIVQTSSAYQSTQGCFLMLRRSRVDLNVVEGSIKTLCNLDLVETL